MDRSEERGVAIVDAFVSDEDTQTVFGKRWQPQIFRLLAKDLDALRRGKYIALDIHGEYVAYLQLVPSEGAESDVAHD